MSEIDLFPEQQIVGVFRGFRDGGLEFHADLSLPYRNDFQSRPMHGHFLLVQLETTDEAVLGRITAFSSDGKLSVGAGEEFNLRAMRERRPVPEDLREQYLKYRVNIRVLGVLRKHVNGKLTFVASHRRLPHVGSYVAFPSDAVLKAIAGHENEGASIGHFALGEYIYAANSELLQTEDWMQIKAPEILVKFPIQNLTSRRSFIFARAGFGKSNLNKLLFSELYKETPKVTKSGGRQVPVGTVIFDPEGEYFWPDDKGRPGLCDVPELQDKLVVFTSRTHSKPFYKSFIADGIKLDIRRLKPSDVIAISLPPERQDQQNVRKLRSLNQDKWEELVNHIDRNRNQADIEKIRDILDLDKYGKQDAEALAARSNMTTIIAAVHDRNSQLMDKLLFSLAKGKLCIIDVSQMRGSQSLMLSGLILRRIFEHNQQQFTSADSKTIPTIAVVEEAQTVLQDKSLASEPYIAWVKEGRKYDLGALLVTQQPGSIPDDILSQGDNWFIFHLLSATDLASVRRANAHFSDDLLSSLLNEPIEGQGVFWTSVNKQQSYPVAIRALSFEMLYKAMPEERTEKAIKTFARLLDKEFATDVEATEREPAFVYSSINGKDVANSADQDHSAKIFASRPSLWGDEFEGDTNGTEDSPDYLEILRERAITSLKNDDEFHRSLHRSEGVSWGEVKAILLRALPKNLDGRDNMAFKLVAPALNKIFGNQDVGWHSYLHSSNGKKYIRLGPKEKSSAE